MHRIARREAFGSTAQIFGLPDYLLCSLRVGGRVRRDRPERASAIAAALKNAPPCALARRYASKTRRLMHRAAKTAPRDYQGSTLHNDVAWLLLNLRAK